ncbi:MAG: DUF6152 family protein [Arenicellaceae bacterium]|nr:DUF6152 family protein [Arenicellaceae bacterium]
MNPNFCRLPIHTSLMRFLTITFVLLTPSFAYAHHSFSAFDINTKIERTGVITRYDYRQPHILMAITVALEIGSDEVWEIESLVPRRWERSGYDKDFVKLGDTATIVGFPACNGSTVMMLSAIKGEKGELVVRDKINQRQ